MDYDFVNDLLLIKQLLGLTDTALAQALGVSRSTLNRWIAGNGITTRLMETVYEYAYSKGLRINDIKSQFHKEESENKGSALLFHGARFPIEGKVDLAHAKTSNDLGVGFYCGETLEQSSMYCAGGKEGSVYLFSASFSGLTQAKLSVDTEWMLAISYFRGRLKGREANPLLRSIVEKIEGADYVIAPIADNKMFSLINNFIDGEITDEQCKHCLSATNLGNQIVLRSEKAIRKLSPLARLYLCASEKNDRLVAREESNRIGNDKVKAARIKYAGQGKYIDQLLGERL